jgi:hypothetical protein
LSLNKLKSLLRTGHIEEVDDSKDIQRSSSSWLHSFGQTIQNIVPYGTFGKAPSKTFQLLLMLKGQESNVAGIPLSRANRIKKDCKDGEYGIGNEIEKSYIYFKDGGDVETKTGDMTVTLSKDGKIKIEGASGEVITIISEWMDNMINAKVVTGIGVMPFDPATIANLTATKEKFDEFKV